MGSFKIDLRLLLVSCIVLLEVAALPNFPNFPSPNDGDGESSDIRAKRNWKAPKCMEGFHLGQKGKKNVKSFTIQSSDVKKGGECNWEIFGDEGCVPELECTGVNLKKSDDCEDEYLLISDGFGGELKVCGEVKPSPIVASKGARDLFVLYKDGGVGSKPFTCEARCSTTKDKKTVLEQTFERKEDARCVCGIQNKDDRIVGGEDAKMNEFPWQAAIVYTGTRQPKCGASVINDRYILTATHCFWFDDMKPDEIEVLSHAYILDMTQKENANENVKLGEEGSIQGSGWDHKDVTDADEKTQRYKVVEIIMHPLFNDRYDYDYALLRIEKKIDLGAADAPTPICLPAAGSDGDTYEGDKPWVVGWGMPDEKAGGTTRVLQKLEIPIIPLKTCQTWLPGLVTQRMVCAGYEAGGKDACTGDSGGPLILKQKNKQWWQIGIVSWGEGCAGFRKPGLYSRVSEMNQWIQYHANKHEAKWCRDKKD